MLRELPTTALLPGGLLNNSTKPEPNWRLPISRTIAVVRRKKVRSLVEPLQPTLIEPCNVQDEAQTRSLFETLQEKWGNFDILIHCLAFAGKDELSGDFSHASREGYLRALEISSYSLVQMAGLAKPLLNEGGSLLTMTYLGGVRVVPNYNVMGIAKAALEMNVRYLAAEFGPAQVRVNAVSAGPIRTLASSAVGGILDMIHHVEQTAPPATDGDPNGSGEHRRLPL